MDDKEIEAALSRAEQCADHNLDPSWEPNLYEAVQCIADLARIIREMRKKPSHVEKLRDFALEHDTSCECANELARLLGDED